MRTASPSQIAAIRRTSREISYAVTINGGSTYPVESFDVTAELKDLPDQISLLGTVAARQATIQIGRGSRKALSPFQGIIPTTAGVPEGSLVQVSVSLWPSRSRSGSPIYSCVRFTGYVTGIKTGTSGCTITALDRSYKLGQNVDIPLSAAYVSNTGTPTGDYGFSSLLPIDLCMRQCGQYLTVPPVYTDPADWAKYTLLSMSGVGGNVPDVGSIYDSYSPNGFQRSAGKFGPDAVSFQTLIASFPPTSPTTITGTLRCDLWAKIDGMTTGGGILQFHAGQFIYADPAYWDGLWHHWVLLVTPTTFQVWTDGVLTSSGANSWTGPLDLTVVLGGFSNDGFVTVQAVDITHTPPGATPKVPAASIASRSAGVPGIPSVMSAPDSRFYALLPQQDLNAWQTIQQLVGAEGAMFTFDEDGAAQFIPRRAWLKARTVPPAVELSGSFLLSDVNISTNADGKRRSVSVPYTKVYTQESTLSTPAFAATDTPGPFPRGVSTTSFDCPPFLKPWAAVRGNTSQPGVASTFWPVESASVGDPAAVAFAAGFVQVAITPTVTGFDLTVTNNTPGPVSFWKPAIGPDPEGPWLVVHGLRIVVDAEKTAIAKSNPTAYDDLVLDSSGWRQDEKSAKLTARLTAADVYNAIPEIDNIQIPGDPRIQLGDLVSLFDPDQMPAPVTCVVITNNEHGDPGSRYEMTLGLRAIAAPSGWVLGVPGRSELGVTTYLPRRDG